MPNRLCAVLAALLASACLLAQEEPEPKGDAFHVVLPDGFEPSHWVPLVVLWQAAPGELNGGLGAMLAAGGFVVVVPGEVQAEAGVGQMLMKVRRRFRIDQGAMHAVITDGHALAVASVLKHQHEFQTVTLVGSAADADIAALRRLRTRRVKALEATDEDGVRDHLLALHRQRVVAGAAGDVARTLDSFHDAAANADAARYFAILPDDAVFLGTDATERWTGKQFRAFAMRYFKRFSAWIYVPMQRHVTVSQDGSFAWFDEVLDNQSYGECRGSGVLVKRDGAWVLQQYNLTVPVPNGLMAGVVGQIRAHASGQAKAVK